MSATSLLHYDVFISHNHADKEWASALADRLAAQRYNGRPLRPWLDRQYIDPGPLADNSELTTALDRSRKLGLVLSPAALASSWVTLELGHFLERRAATDVIPILRHDCERPMALRDLPVLDLRPGHESEIRFGELVAALCPATAISLDDVKRSVDLAIEASLASDPGGLSPDPTPERDGVFEALVRYDIEDAAFEGLAIAAFERAADHVLRLHDRRDDRTYNAKMLLGECLAAALVRSAGYRQVAQRLLDVAAVQAGDPVLLFVIARAFSKLAEIDARLIDTSVLLRLTAQLDAKTSVGNEQKAIEALLGRVAGKLRGTAAGDLLIKNLIEAGRSSRIAAIAAISLSYKRGGGPVFYISELQRHHQRRDADQQLHRDPPSKRMLALLFAADLDQPRDVADALRLARQDIERAFPGTDLPYGYSWLGLRRGIAVENAHLAPFMGIVVKATLANMIEQGGRSSEVSTVACLTQPRIIEALFQNCGALLIPVQDADSHQCKRLRGRGVPFAMVSEQTMALLEDGDAMVVDGREIRIWSRSSARDL